MTATGWIALLLSGGVLGMIGQSIRVIVGLKKLNDKAQRQGLAFGEAFSASTLVVSLLIGFVAGALGALGLEPGPGGTLERQHVTMLLGAGYAGADFIEGFIRKSLPAQAQQAPTGSPEGAHPGSSAARTAPPPERGRDEPRT